ncbi:Putative competence-damage inducible protein [Aquisphaera giovannonii]|uniref:CinA-like protein n=1 Tax=Aquisphaera giovannonii TaxID=406548 RepID=A0A5B9W6L7_9BACT|nr:competence/damage-inducible protein A [Aquisphaera giovannonii]QEH36306.1 Putative competence-damage inducible protein [Aquisphaera giovannonii]
MLKAETLAIGTELVSGQSLDTNSQWLARELGAIGIPTLFHQTVCDQLEENVSALRIAAGRAGLVLLTGGLGPTRDDLTRDALAAYAGVPLREDPASLEAIRAMFARRNRPMADRNRVQALFPEGAEPLPNRVGTAPGIWMEHGGVAFACMPGIPSEMRVMFFEQVVPRLKARSWGTRSIVFRKINMFGRGESEIEAMSPDLTARDRVPEVGITAHQATISFRIRGEGDTPEEALAQTEPTAALIRERFGDLILGEGAEDLPEAVFAELRRTGATLATAESCTGGLVAQMITALVGVSPYFLGGVVSYANSAKAAFLDVPVEMLDAHGAVSPEVAEAMAAGARRRFGADLAISTTGVAGPTGGTPEKPVGLVYLGLATEAGTQSRRLEIGPEQPRDIIQHRAAKNALNWVRLALRERPGKD